MVTKKNLACCAVTIATLLSINSNIQAREYNRAGESIPVDHRISEKEAFEAVNKYKRWMIGPMTATPVAASLTPVLKANPDSFNNIKNLTRKRFLQREHQKNGVDLGWTNNASNKTAVKKKRWTFHPIDRGRSDKSSTRPLRYGERVAIAWTTIKPGSNNGHYVNYKRQKKGINLALSTDPSYTWVILGGKPGTIVKRGQRVIIYNLVIQEPLVYDKRKRGANISWAGHMCMKRSLSLDCTLVINKVPPHAVFQKIMMKNARRYSTKLSNVD